MPLVTLSDVAPNVPPTLEIGATEDHEGGEARLFFTRDGKYVVKIYHGLKATQEYMDGKRKLLQKVRVLGSHLSADEAQFLAWPLALVDAVDGSKRIGCVTRYFPLKRLENYIAVSGALKQFRSGMKWSTYLQMARGVARCTSVLYLKGCAHADIQPKNYLADPKSGQVVLIDLDGLVVPGFLPHQVNGFKGFMAPEVVEGTAYPSGNTDRHSLAVLVLNTLLFRNVMDPRVCYDDKDDLNSEKIGYGREAVFSEHPSDHRNLLTGTGSPLFKKGYFSYRSLTPALQELTEQALVQGLREPHRRPTPKQWIDALSCAMDELCHCQACDQFLPYPHTLPSEKRSCPFCGARLASPNPSVLRLYNPSVGGKYSLVRQRYVVLPAGWRLFSDVLDPALVPPISRKGESSIVAHLERDEKRHVNVLVNDEGGEWKARATQDSATVVAGKGNSIVLAPGTIISAGDGRRVLRVQE